MFNLEHSNIANTYLSLFIRQNMVKTDWNPKMYCGIMKQIDVQLLQEIVFLNRNENSATLFSYVCNAKKIKSCVTLLKME